MPPPLPHTHTNTHFPHSPCTRHFWVWQLRRARWILPHQARLKYHFNWISNSRTSKVYIVQGRLRLLIQQQTQLKTPHFLYWCWTYLYKHFCPHYCWGGSAQTGLIEVSLRGLLVCLNLRHKVWLGFLDHSRNINDFEKRKSQFHAWYVTLNNKLIWF